MRISISNLAWEPNEDQAVAKLLNRLSVDAIDIVPFKYFAPGVEREKIIAVRNWWKNLGIEVIGMQALLAGTSGLNLFGESNRAMLEHLTAICRIAGILESPRLVFGSPKNKDRNGLGDAEAIEESVLFFRKLGSIAQNEGVVVCVEPTPACYGADFLTTTSETAKIVQMVDSPGIKLHLDSGALTINTDDPDLIISKYSELIGHVHISEPNLVLVGSGLVDHRLMYAALSKYLPENIISIEMLATKERPHLESIEQAITYVDKYYRTNTSRRLI